MPTPKSSSLPIEVRDSLIHGKGAFAARDIRAGAVVGTYAGRRYSAEQQHARRWDKARTYVFGLSDGSLINGAQGGNATRHINHSCTPNCAAYEITDPDGALTVQIEALRRIRAGQELFLDYSLDIGEDTTADYPCHCGTPRCRGTMASPAAAP